MKNGESKMGKRKLGLTTKIFIGMTLGIIAGLIASRLSGGVYEFVVNGLFHVGGTIFKRAIQMLVVPLVFVSIVNGAANMGDVSKLGRVGVKTLGFYLVTTAVAIIIALVIASIVNPGLGLDMSDLVKGDPTINQKTPLSQVLIEMIPKNPIKSLSSGNMLQIIIFALLSGVTLSLLGEKTSGLLKLFRELDHFMMKIVDIVMRLAPYGVFFLIAKTFATTGADAIKPLIKYMLTVIGVLFVHAFITYSTLLKLFANLSPVKFYKKFASVMSIAFSTSSSNATIPVTIEKVEEEMGVNQTIASFTIPLGATINMDGTSIMQGVAVIFIAQVYGMTLTLSGLLTVVLTATLATIGTAGVPGVGLITLAMVLNSVGLPTEGIALILGIDRILDMIRTAVNVSGDAVCTLIVAKSEGEMNEEIFNS
ncbi:MAG: dicarboxylate/amino acid:cation symporter [Candidatus Muiribacterium halophilum]|uniref:Dicarboxylate/amino acid:cation symporter n=1 Tax=Muiribacterium halophilum TaxID=2053465 RepID=A0A2N5ZG63_MUIH1|nr:MAG: dicarboxylate/amino acid:cation symporter [Candidatus Muirbacterium halophilum]